jgi:steroid 5-alpha reductase family enzyme
MIVHTCKNVKGHVSIQLAICNKPGASGVDEYNSKDQALVKVVVAYVVALFAAGVTLAWVDYNPLLDILIADIVATLVIFLFSVAYRNCSFYDAYWSIVPPLIALYWLSLDLSQASALRELLLLGLILYWATRLTLNWAYHWEGLHHEDWRYIGLRERSSLPDLVVNFFGVHLFPTLQVFLALLPVYAVYCLGERGFNWLDIVAALVTAGAITLQMLADFQLHGFIRKRKEGEHLDSGLWAWSRHPNYFGELGFWAGLCLFGLAAFPAGWYWQVAGIAGMLLMFLFVSIPMMEQRSLVRRPSYQSVIDSVSMLVPWPPRRKAP